MADGGVWCLLDNYVSGGISHVAMQLDVQRKSANAKYKYPAVVIPPWRDQHMPVKVSPARNFVIFWGSSAKYR